MPPGIGYNFQFGAERPRTQPGGGGGVSGLSPQEAVKFLSLRLPDRQSPTAIASQALLRAPGAAGLSGHGDANLQAVIQGLMQLFSGGGHSTPTPRVIPVDPNQPMGGTATQPTVPPQDFPVPEGGLSRLPPAQPPQDFPVPGGGVGGGIMQRTKMGPYGMDQPQPLF